MHIITRHGARRSHEVKNYKRKDITGKIQYNIGRCIRREGNN